MAGVLFLPLPFGFQIVLRGTKQDGRAEPDHRAKNEEKEDASGADAAFEQHSSGIYKDRNGNEPKRNNQQPDARKDDGLGAPDL